MYHHLHQHQHQHHNRSTIGRSSRKSKKKSGSIRSEDLSDHSDEDHDAPDLPSMIRSKSDSQYPTGMNKNLTAIIFDDEEEGMCSFSKVTQC